MSEPTVSPAAGEAAALRARPAAVPAELAERPVEAIRPMVETERANGVAARAPARLSLPLDAVKIGTRHRGKMGDIDGLARSIKAVGLLHPVVIRPDGLLIAGERRLVACRKLGWAEVPITEVDLDQVARGELAENSDRKDFLPSEIDAIRKALAPIEEAAAKERMSE